MEDLRINDDLVIPAGELVFRFARSGGPGGQHADTSETQAELRFDVEGSASLSAAQRAAVRAHLGHRLTQEGTLVVVANEHRSQARNRQAARERLRALVAEALVPARPRKPTRPSAAARRRRLEAKRRHSEKKARRRPPEPPP